MNMYNSQRLVHQKGYCPWQDNMAAGAGYEAGRWRMPGLRNSRQALGTKGC